MVRTYEDDAGNVHTLHEYFPITRFSNRELGQLQELLQTNAIQLWRLDRAGVLWFRLLI